MTTNKNGITKILYQDLAQMTVPAGIIPNVTLSVLSKFWCSPMNLRGDCTTNCTNCAKRLNAAFARYNRAEKVVNPAAFLTWIVRDAQGIAADELQAERHAAPRKLAEDPFLALKKEFGV